MTPQQVVRDFCAAFARCDVTELLGFLAEDAVYHNMPMPPVRGHAAIRGVLAQFLAPCAKAEFEVRAIAGQDAVVLTERVDRFWLQDGRRIELPVMGAFEVGADGKIHAWRDYFDLPSWTRQMQGG